MKKLVSIILFAVIVYAVAFTYGFLPKNLSFNPLVKPVQKASPEVAQTVVYEESTVTTVVEKSLPSVVTIGIQKTTTGRDTIQINPLDPFQPFRRIPGESREVDQNIGSGFIVSADGLIITNKHVVSDSEAAYTVLTDDDKKFDVKQIYRDPLNDVAILKIDASGLRPLALADSNTLKLGQMAIAIGTPLGEFTNTVTAGIISGLGRGITAGSPFEGFVEKLDNIIQTDAAISPGNSGGPLLNSKGLVIGVNTAVSSEGQNIGFAIPSNVVKNVIDSFKKRGGTFERPYLGIRYRILSKTLAIQNELVEGAYVMDVMDGSPASKAGIKEGDVVTEMDGNKVAGNDDQLLTKLLLEKKVGDKIALKLWRDGSISDLAVTLEASTE